MNEKIEILRGIIDIPVAIAKRRLNIHMNREQRMQIDEFNEWLRDRINHYVPTAIVRFGAVEMKVLRKYAINEVLGLHLSMKSEAEKLCSNAGFFPNSLELINRFCTTYIDLLPECDAIGCWDLAFERYYINKFTLNVIQTELMNLEPYYSDCPWSEALAGKKVLIIHPFVESIKRQYETKRDKLFANKNVLPYFDMKCVKAVQSIGGIPDDDSIDWFEALDKMYNNAMKEDFDVAIIGCGAYGLPLALKIKQQGKIAIHLGGATQMMFGVYGKRWENKLSYLINDYWVRPSDNEKCPTFSNVEKGCYW